MNFSYQEITLSKTATLLLAEMPSEAIDQNSIPLLQEEVAYVQNIMNKRRKQEWLLTRALLLKKMPNANILYYDTGQPYLSNNEFQISISHSKNQVAIAFSERKIGIDLQFIVTTLRKVHTKFISAAEREFISELDITHLCILWSAKEALYKLHAKGGLDFKKNMQLVAPICNENNKLQMNLLVDLNSELHQIQFIQFNNYIITWVEHDL